MQSDIDQTLKHISFIARHLHNCDPECIIVIILMELGMEPKTDGFDYLKIAIPFYWKNPAPMVTKTIYPMIAKHYDDHVRGSHVERSIRNAIHMAWKVRDNEVWKRYFACREDGTVEKPTNAEFISRIAAVLDLWKGCCAAYEHPYDE